MELMIAVLREQVKNDMVLASITFVAVVVVDDDILTVFCSRLL